VIKIDIDKVVKHLCTGESGSKQKRHRFFLPVKPYKFSDAELSRAKCHAQAEKNTNRADACDG
jgi:hypothetical protein